MTCGTHFNNGGSALAILRNGWHTGKRKIMLSVILKIGWHTCKRKVTLMLMVGGVQWSFPLSI
jgi:hypothetical protein